MNFLYLLISPRELNFGVIDVNLISLIMLIYTYFIY